tara:strand:+ start:1978 stop:2733 length:756 start_codon:yes stop_codon:yes gene_type:complete
MSLITVENVGVSFGKSTALSDVNFEIKRGEIVTIVGPNGSGKSTFLRAIIGAIKPSKGEIKRRKGLKIGYVPQKLEIDPSLPLSVARFMSLPVRQAKSDIDEALKRAGIADLSMRQMVDLSGGQFQRVLLARALLSNPDLLILDEATRGLDQLGSANFYQRIAELRETMGCAILMVSHELHVVMSASDRVVCLNGHICCQGTPDLVASAPEYRALFGTGTGGALALYRHDHDHDHNFDCDHPTHELGHDHV